MWLSKIQCLLILLLALVGFISCIENREEIEKTLEDAMRESLKIMEERLRLAKLRSKNKPPDDGKLHDFQQPGIETAKLQWPPKIYRLVTGFMVRKYGVGIFSTANEIINEWRKTGKHYELMQKIDHPKLDIFRSKRAAKKKCESPPEDCSDEYHSKTRSITGLCNNMKRPKLANSMTPVRRLLGEALFEDGYETIRSKSITGKDLLSTRQISNILHDDTGHEVFAAKTNHLHMQMGQFLAHDIILNTISSGENGERLNCTACDSPIKESPDCSPIPVPKDDPYFKSSCMKLIRTMDSQDGTGYRTPFNQNTHFVDLSVVYGSEDCEARTVRSFENGRLASVQWKDYILPPQDKKDVRCQSKDPHFCFTCGDLRNSLHPALIPIHAIFIKEHNRISEIIQSRRLGWNDEQIFQLTRKIMIGMWQHIVYNEYLPKVLPREILEKFDLIPLEEGHYQNYNEGGDPRLSAEFAAAAFRFGHSQARAKFPRFNEHNESLGEYDLGSNVFYAEQNYLDKLGGWESILKGLMNAPAMKPDRYFSFPIRNQLFEIRGRQGSGFDLVAVNMMRGRDVGLLPYYKYRSFVGLPPINQWDDLRGTFSNANIKALKKAYADPRDIDLYPGLMMENHVPGGKLGPTATYIIAEQFKALKTGDRFYYESQVNGTDNFTEEQLAELRKARLAKMICTNSEFAKMIPLKIFDIRSPLINCSSIPEVDIEMFLNSSRHGSHSIILMFLFVFYVLFGNN